MQSSTLDFSIIIPVYKEFRLLPRLIEYLTSCSWNGSSYEIIVVEASSTQTENDRSISDHIHFLFSDIPSRAHQQNIGAEFSKGKVLFFLHADVLPPTNFPGLVLNAIDTGAESGCFRSRFDSNLWLLRINEFFTRYYFLWCRGGDQTLFINRDLFFKYGKFDEAYIIMEEYPLIKRLIAEKKFMILKESVLISARKYIVNSYLKVQLANFIAFRMFQNRISSDKIQALYHKMLGNAR